MKKHVIVLLFVLLLVGCKEQDNLQIEVKKASPKQVPLSERTIVAATSYNSTDYFIYKGQPLGFQFELLQNMSNALGIKLEVIVENDLDKKLNKLANSKCDIISDNLAITNDRKQYMDFTIPLGTITQVLVQRKPKGWRNMTQDQIKDQLVKNPLDLAGKDIYVQAKSSYVERLNNLGNEIGDSIRIREVRADGEKLIEKVLSGDIDYTVCESNVAKAIKHLHPELDMETEISFPQYFAWAVRKDDTLLLDALNGWLENYTKTTDYRIVYNKYFSEKSISRNKTSEYFIIKEGKVSMYDKYIRKYSNEIGWDWRLLAAMIYQESRFKPSAKSYAGAFGIMQLMPTTAEMYGVDSLSTPEEHIKAGVSFLKWLNKKLDEQGITGEDKIKFMLASYNAGYGHILDAMRLAKKNGKNPFVWEDNVDYYVLNKSKAEYYNDPVVKHGYCRGREPYNYVNEIMERYTHYKNIIK